jgi:hypothetical protein
MGEGCSGQIYGSLIPNSNTFMIKFLKEKHSCIRSTIIKIVNSTWIIKKLLSIKNIDPNISNETLDIILEDKFDISNVNEYLLWLIYVIFQMHVGTFRSSQHSTQNNYVDWRI